ncbi:tRNA-5-carboxymethylaminomethyl-2-thiouridine(34)synthesis protein MnmE [hydrothermal vent metagenome]|uniref:tRNA-5-carboxymethylaminomethyl-2-thiouridine(34) synthesis protein MnmE n=1 Tax=hydrothermal vent metagenome TaxID=652676 RepID=A0A3B1B6A2_9ZZZZ
MISTDTDTIVALATPPGRGGVGIIRLSGSEVPSFIPSLLSLMPKPREALLCDFIDDQHNAIDSGLALYFPAPHSFTGEHVLELQGHGGPVVMDMLLQRVIELGARHATAGEFSQRAFLNDKLDLAQAEAIADLIDAGSRQAVQAAQRSLQGDFSKAVHALVQSLIQLRIYVESAIDFPEEEIDFLSDGKVLADALKIEQDCQAILQNAQRGCLLQEGMQVVLAGCPNVGKSSLLNALAGRDSAIVTEIAGTTRDVLRESIQLDGMPVHLIDTAGLRESEDIVEQEGIRRAWIAIQQADQILMLVDANHGITEQDQLLVKQFPENLDLCFVYNKIDTLDATENIKLQQARLELNKNQAAHIYLSAKTGEGIILLEQYLKDKMNFVQVDNSQYSARRRHINALESGLAFIQQGIKQLTTSQAGELLAEDLRLAQNDLSEITGEFSNDDLLGEIFSSFCIGK